jgi:hypothetical protein
MKIDSRPIVSSFWLGPLLAIFLFVLLGPIPRSLDESYPLSNDYHFQMFAFEQGHLRLGESPQGASHDWSWGNGIQQPWGLGVPALQYPFFSLVRSLGGQYLPEIPIYLFWFVLVVFALKFMFRRWAVDGGESNILVLFFLAHPVLFLMLRQRFAVYETAIAYGVLTASAGYAFTLATLHRGSDRSALSVAFFLGFLSFIKPTLVIYSWVSVTLLLFSFLGNRRHWPQAIGVLVAFLPGGFLHLWTNHERFGSWHEFGYGMVTSGNIVIDYSVRLFNQMREVSTPALFAELAGMLFSNTVIDGNFSDFLGSAPLLPGQNPIIRLRELSFSTFSVVSLLLLFVSLTLLIAQTLPAQMRERFRTTRLETLTLTWGLMNFTGLFFFYSHAPVFCARYGVDFVPAFAALETALALFFFRWLRGPRSPFPQLPTWLVILVSLVLVISFITLGVATGNHWSLFRPPPFVSRDRFEQGIKSLQEELARRTDALSSEYRCQSTYLSTGLRYNLDGWHRDSCRVEAMTTVYLPSSHCVELDLERDSPTTDPDLDEVYVKRGPVFLTRLPSLSPSSFLNETGTTSLQRIKFCELEMDQRNPYHIELYSIAWISPRKFALDRGTSIRLKAIRAID